MSTDVLDATGNPVEIGKLYGYSTSKGGWARTVIGRAAKITATGRVTLDVTSTKTFLYGKITEWHEGSPTTHIRSYHLFPVQEAQNESAG